MNKYFLFDLNEYICEYDIFTNILNLFPLCSTLNKSLKLSVSWYKRIYRVCIFL